MKALLAASAAIVAFGASGGVAVAATYDFGLLATGAGVGEGSWDSRANETDVAGGDFEIVFEHALHRYFVRLRQSTHGFIIRP